MKKQVFALILAAAMLLTLAGCAPKTETTYILTEFETTMSSGEVHKTVFHFDENWAQTGATVYLNGEVTQEMTYELDEQGSLESITYAMGEETFLEDYVNTYDSDGNLIRQETWQDGALTGSVDYTYDDDGNRVSSVQTNLAYPGGITYETFYNPDGTTASMGVTIADTDASLTEYIYDENGNEIRSVTTNEAGVVISETNSSYNADGKITVSVETHYNDDGTPRETSSAEYTWEGNVRTTHASGDPDSYSVIEYDDAGNMIRSEIYSGGKLITAQSCTYVQVEVPAE